MKNSLTTIRVASLLLIGALAGAMFVLDKVDDIRGPQATLEEVLYIPSSKTLKRMSLGYSSLLADIYWTRAVQYFGEKHMVEDVHYDLLYPLLDITSDLDPHLLVTYKYGALFLSQAPPEGAGEPDKAVALMEKGIRANPDEWRLYFTLGFIHYMDRHDPKAASEAFEKGSENPKAYVWMKVMAASMAQQADETSVATALWSELYRSAEDKMIRDNALQHLAALRIDQDVAELESKIAAYREHTGRWPANWRDLENERLIPGTPIDLNGKPFKLMPDGTVQVQDPDRFPFITRGLPPGWKRTPRRQ